MRFLAPSVLWLGGLGFLGFGVAFLLAPLQTIAMAGLPLDGAVAATELMAFYGGLEIALGALLVACALKPSRRRDGLVLMLATYAGIGLARVVGMLTTGGDTPFLRVALALELGFALLAAIALYTARR